MDLLKLKREELRKVGEWSPSSGLNITDSTAFYETTTPNITLIVMTREDIRQRAKREAMAINVIPAEQVLNGL
ncbi:unnamed protein product [Nezara viridula]|uniref:Uncharacterized protein n=1 Tax=Nezara viridula TaxID=85310 RepID=A0A9P0MXT0_NEZVI|nr:unnamed protein product [Nezara viridula]